MDKEQMKYLDGKIAEAKETWKGVDVDAYMDEVRGSDGNGTDKKNE